MGKAILFVTNMCDKADQSFLQRLFGVYGKVDDVTTMTFDDNPCARITYAHADDADTAVATLHLRYNTMANQALIVLYDKTSPIVTTYGRLVGRQYREAQQEGTMPQPVPLETFDKSIERGKVEPPPSIFDHMNTVGDTPAPPVPTPDPAGGPAPVSAGAVPFSMNVPPQSAPINAVPYFPQMQVPMAMAANPALMAQGGMPWGTAPFPGAAGAFGMPGAQAPGGAVTWSQPTGQLPFSYGGASQPQN